MKGKNVCIWKLEKSLEEILPLLHKNYSCYVDSLHDANISEEEKKLINRWVSLDAPDDFVIKSIEFEGINVKYIKAIAEIEFNAIPYDDWLVDGEPLPKEIRVNKEHSSVLFTEVGGFVYAIVCGSKSLEGRIRSRLMEVRRKESEWGSVESKNIAEYTFVKEFYYWILKNNGEILYDIENKVILRKVKLNEVKGFKCNADRKDMSYQGEGNNIDSEIPLKALVCTDEKFISLYMDILIDDKVKYSFFLDYDGRLVVKDGDCGVFGTQNPKKIPLNKILIKIYFDIIPFLLKKFNIANGGELQNELLEFKKKLSIDIILELMKQNYISIKDLETASDKN